MVQINFARKEINCKIVYYGPGLSGKTTSLEVVHQKTPDGNKGDLTSISTDGDRTLFFDFMPLDLGKIAGMQTKFHLYTVPGQVYYNSTRKLVLMGADGIIFVADSSPGRIEDNLTSLQNLRENLAEMGRDVDHVPVVLQYNKRDIPGALTVAELDAKLNPNAVPAFESSAKTGEGVFQTLKAISAKVLEDINTQQKRVAAPPTGRPLPPLQPRPAAGQAAPPAGKPSILTPRRPAAQQAAPAAAPATAAASASPGAPVATAPPPRKQALAQPQAAQPAPQEPMPTVAPQAVDEPPVAERIVATRRVVTNTGVKEAPLERRRNTSGSGGKLVLWLVLGILAGGVVAFLAAKFVLGIDLTDLQSLRGGK